jgi:hypothetical protein
MNINDKSLIQLKDILENIVIGYNATSYKLPLIVEEVKEYENKICVQTLNIKGKYIVFDKDTLMSAFNKYTGENTNDNNNKKET